MTETGTKTSAPRRLAGWIRRRRVLAITLAVSMLAVLGLVGFIATRSGPEDLVRDYLDVLKSGDAEAALEYTSGTKDLDTATDALLADGAMSTDWRVTELVNRYEDDHSASVDVTITAADKTARKGRFALDADGPDGWYITNPLVKLDLTNLPMRYAEFNGEMADAKTLEASAATAEQGTQPGVYAWVFPGAYQPYGDSADQLKLSIGTFVAAPSALSADGVIPERFLPQITTREVQPADANDQFADWIDACAKSTDVNPPGCPFAGGSHHEPRRITLDDGDVFIADKVKWKVKTYPVIRLLQGGQSFTVREVEPGEVTISGTGTDEAGDGSKREFEGDCDIRLDRATAELVEPGTYTFSGAGPDAEDAQQYTCSLRYI